MQSEKIVIAEMCVQLRKLAKSGVLAEDTAESCRQAASLLEKMREKVLGATKGNPEAMTHAEAAALAKNINWIMVEQGEG